MKKYYFIVLLLVSFNMYSQNSNHNFGSKLGLEIDFQHQTFSYSYYQHYFISTEYTYSKKFIGLCIGIKYQTKYHIARLNSSLFTLYSGDNSMTNPLIGPKRHPYMLIGFPYHALLNYSPNLVFFTNTGNKSRFHIGPSISFGWTFSHLNRQSNCPLIGYGFECSFKNISLGVSKQKWINIQIEDIDAISFTNLKIGYSFPLSNISSSIN